LQKQFTCVNFLNHLPIQWVQGEISIQSGVRSWSRTSIWCWG